MSNIFKYNQGDELKDTITNAKGIVTGRIEYITGCKQYLLSFKVGKDNTMKDAVWLDESRVELLKSKVSIKKEPTGGVHPTYKNTSSSPKNSKPSRSI